MGKSLAMMELRSVVQRVIEGFEVMIADDDEWDAEKWFDAIKDHFTAGCPEVKVRFARKI